MEYRFESHSEITDFEPVGLFDTLWQHADPRPVGIREPGIVKRIQRWSLQTHW